MSGNRILRRDLEYSLRDKDLEINEKMVKKKKSDVRPSPSCDRPGP